MIKVFEHFELAIVGHFQSVLEAEGIRTYLKNQFTTGVLGEIPFVEAVPELWVVDDRDLPQANALLRKLQNREGEDSAEWKCPKCQGMVEGVFNACWNCGEPRMTDEEAQAS